MTAHEFGEWQVIFRNEQQHPAAEGLRHAQLMAATLNGPVTRSSGGMFTAAELMGADRWAAPVDPEAPRAEDLAAQIDRLNKAQAAS